MPAKSIERLSDWFFKQIHSNTLIYNTCWEDPRCDRKLLELDTDSKVVMITSAGCNALSYLLDDPMQIHCIDMNPRQNALLQLKLAAIQNLEYGELFQLFGKGMHPQAKEVYREQLREALPGFAQSYWDKKIHFFNGKGLRKSFYHQGSSGTLAWLANRYLKVQRQLYSNVTRLFEAENMEQQAAIYYQIEPRIFNRPVEWAFNRHLTMCLAGVPRAQQELFVNKYERGAVDFLQECMRKVFTEQSLEDNYFYRVYVKGSYTPDCCPAYLEPDNHETLKGRSNRVNTYNSTISQFLVENPGSYSHFILLDHQDWLAEHNVPALNEEWDLILKNSRPGTRILLRSAAEEVDFFPDVVHDRVHFEKEKTQQVHQEDRVGTYASVYLGIVK